MTPSNVQHQINAHRSVNGVRYSHGQAIPAKRSWTSNPQDTSASTSDMSADKDGNAVGVGRHRLMNDLYARSERMLVKLLSAPLPHIAVHEPSEVAGIDGGDRPSVAVTELRTQLAKTVRTLDEDDYGDEDDEAEEEDTTQSGVEHGLPANQDDLSSLNQPMLPKPRLAGPPHDLGSTDSSQNQPQSPEQVRKSLEEEKKAAEQTARDSFLSTFYTLENDRDAMLEQQKLDDLDRQVENEMSGPDGMNNKSKAGTGAQPGSLSSANLGASSLALKHLIARIDAKRDMVHASDTKLRSLMSEVRKNRSKWASEERVGQEELYEAAERVLMDLKGMTEYATPFLQRVNRREAPDYYKVITKPMDIGTMLKKLRSFEYRSKRDFVHDLELIWANCLRYNAAPDHALRKKAEHMKKETARLTPLIPDITIKDRATVEAEEREERKKQYAELDSDDDDQPIVATRGRKAPSKKGLKGTSSARKAPPAAPTESPAPDSRPSLPPPPGIRHDSLRFDVDGPADGSQQGLSTPPPGSTTPLDNGSAYDGATQGDVGDGTGLPALEHVEDPEDEDEAYKTWKQVTKKDRAQVASDRHRLFESDRLNADEPALLRTKAGMRRWMRQQKKLTGEKDADHQSANQEQREVIDAPQTSTTLAEDIDADDDVILPDYYQALAGVPQINPRIQWTEDTEGHVIDQREECLRVVSKGQFTSTESALTSRIDSNMKQMQNTRKVMAKIGMVKQMQLQSQTYQNQFQKYEPEPFLEADIEPTVVSDDGPVMAPWVSRAGLQRSVAKLFYHAGFEDYQPSTLDAVTDLAADHFKNLVKTLQVYQEAPMTVSASMENLPGKDTLTTQISEGTGVPVSGGRQVQPRFTNEEAILHTLQANGHELDSLTTYIEEDVPRISTKLTAHHENVRQYYADLVRPALDPTSVAYDGGASAFNDGSEAQFVAGDFAEDIDEDFFGFKELGLDREFGIQALSVPLHLLQSRMHNAYQPASVAGAANATTEIIMENPPAWEPVTLDNVHEQIGLVQAFFAEKFEKMKETDAVALIEDEELPQKQRFPKPRLPPTGKISSPRKRPPREQAMMARKKRRMEIEAEREREREESGALARGTSTLSATGPPGSTAEIAGNAAAPSNNEVATTSDQSNDSRRPSTTLVNGNTPNGTSGLVNGGTHDHDSDQHNDEKVPELARPARKLKLDTPQEASIIANTDPEKGSTQSASDKDREHKTDINGTTEQAGRDEDGEGQMLSPESLPIAAH